MPHSIAQNREEILARIAKRCAQTGREVNSVALIAVSKQQSDERVAAMLDTGHMVYGENRVQEATQRWADTFADRREGLELHLIGPLQSNKTKAACELFDVIQTLDRESLAKALARQAQATGRIPKLFVQINTGAEPQKAGVLAQDADRFLETMRRNYDLPVGGLMCIPPAFEKYVGQFGGQAPGPHFALLAKIAARNGIENLSMGMSADYEPAVDFGASHVRVGSALFGAR